MQFSARRLLAIATAAFLAGRSSGGEGSTPADGGPTTAAAMSATTEVDPAAADFASLEDSYAAEPWGSTPSTPRRATPSSTASDERFAFVLTDKVLSAAAVLQDSDPADLDEVIHYEQADIVGHSPISEAQVDTGLTVLETIRAAIAVSDNTAANLLFERLGGPPGLEAALRAWGDDTTSVDRWEPELSEWAPGETRDTSTPRAMAENLEALTIGTVRRRRTATSWSPP